MMVLLYIDLASSNFDIMQRIIQKKASYSISVLWCFVNVKKKTGVCKNTPYLIYRLKLNSRKMREN